MLSNVVFTKVALPGGRVGTSAGPAVQAAKRGRPRDGLLPTRAQSGGKDPTADTGNLKSSMKNSKPNL